jgi:hypothetical protein
MHCAKNASKDKLNRLTNRSLGLLRAIAAGLTAGKTLSCLNRYIMGKPQGPYLQGQL